MKPMNHASRLSFVVPVLPAAILRKPIERARAARARVRMEHRLKQIDRIMTQEVRATKMAEETALSMSSDTAGPANGNGGAAKPSAAAVRPADTCRASSSTSARAASRSAVGVLPLTARARQPPARKAAATSSACCTLTQKATAGSPAASRP